MGSSLKTATFLIESRMRDAAKGSISAYYDLGMVYSSGSEGVEIDLVEAHKWFNLAAIGGLSRAQECRAEIADEMSAREIVEAQKRARGWMQLTMRAAA